MTSTEGIHTFGNIRLSGKEDLGALKLHADGFAWKSKNTGKVVSVQADQIESIEWTRLSRDHQVKLLLKGGSNVKFDGFRETDAEVIEKGVSKPFHKTQMFTKGWNWGDFLFEGSMLTCRGDKRLVFEIPVSDISNSSVPAKNEVAIEFHQDDTRNPQDETLTEMRLYVPPAVKETDGEAVPDVEDEEEMDYAQSFHELLLAKADIGSFAGESIVSFTEMPMVTPRGRYEVDMYATFMKFHGKSHDYKIMYKNINKLFLLPKPDQRHVAFIIGLDTPVRQGQTLYPFLVLQFPKEREVEIDVQLTEDEIKQRYPDGGLQPKLEGPLYHVVSNVFKALTGVKVIIPGNFKNASGTHAVRCSVKASDGHLYPLNKSFFFINKPVIYIRFEDVLSVEFARVSEGSSNTNRSFDLIVSCKSDVEHQFTSIDKNEYQPLFDFLQSKKIKIINIAQNTTVMDVDKLLGSESESEDEKSRGKRKREPVKGQPVQLDDDEDDSENDEDYKGSEGESSDVSLDEEDEDEDDEEKPAKKSKKEDKGEKKKKAKKDKKDKKDKKEKKKKSKSDD
eukprot:GILK01003160.1.p1 GENE.GILK01003160.1~~GILK01003160.1.p1  ORF type:complete len:580 (+),score=152.64 GILK01003160.1:54-1742(+)